MKPRYTVIIHTPQELNHSSYIQTGLFELANQGIIDVRVNLSIRKRNAMFSVNEQGEISTKNRGFPKASYYTLVDCSTNKRISFATDLYDSAKCFSKFALKKCDFYFKRNYESKYVEAIKEKAKARIYNLGMTFGTHSEFRKNRLKFLVGLF